jgi:hypothetical protein
LGELGWGAGNSFSINVGSGGVLGAALSKLGWGAFSSGFINVSSGGVLGAS